MFRYTTLRTLLTFLILLLFPFWSFANNKIEENACYGNDKLSRLVREITDAKVEKSNRKDSGIGEAFTFGYAEADVDGNRSLLYSNQVMKFDYYASSVGASLGGTRLVNAVRLYGNSSRLDEKYMEIYLSSEGLDGSWYKAETFCIEKDESGLKVIFAEPIEAGYVKIHSTWDERDVAYSPVDCSETRGTPYDLLEVFIIQKGRRNEWSYDARGNRIDSTVDNNSLVIEYYENSDLLKKYGEWYFNYDANGNMIARGKNGTKKIAAASNELFEGYVFSSDTGELWTYEYDLSNRLVKVNYSGSGTAELKEKAEYLYDYRGLCIAKTSGNETEYHEYTADGRLIYTERSDYVADYVYSGTSIFAEVRKQNGNDETFYHHTDHLGTTEVITDESGTVVWKASYEAFGSVLCENGTRVFEASFTGKFFDKDIGLYYFNARWYDAETGKFVTQDPARDGGNWWNYCCSNPVTYIDPDGMKINNLTDDQWEQVKNTKDNLVSNLNILVVRIQDANYDVEKLDSSILTAAKKYLTSEFGTLPADLSVLASTLKDLSNHIDGLKRTDFKYDDAEQDAFAYTFPLLDNIYLCDVYFNNASDSGKDTKEGTILHEVTHYFWGLSTKDHTYVEREMRNLPDNKKLKNANNWEYFYEELMN